MSQEKQANILKSDDEDPKEILDSGSEQSVDGADELDPETFRQKYPLDHIRRIVDTKMTNLDPEHLESQAEVVNLFTQMYIVSDYAYCDRVDSLYIQIMDPFYRQRVRDHNRNAEPLVDTYFSQSADTFDQNNFIFSLLTKYSNSGSINFGEVAIAEAALMVLVESLELGLWHYEQLEKVMEALFERTENLHKVEENIKRDGEILPEKIAKQMLACKEAVATAQLQMTIFHNDYWFVMSCKSINEKIPKKRGHSSTNPKKDAMTVPYYNLKPFQETAKPYNNWSLIIFNYQFYSVEFEDNVLITDSYRTTMHHLIMMINDTRLDPFILSQDLIKREYLLFYFLESIDEEYLSAADNIMKKLNELFDIKAENITRTDVEKPILKIYEKLEYQLSLQDDKFATKLMLTERAFPIRLLKMMKLIASVLTNDVDKEICHELILRGFKALSSIMTGNYPAQAMVLKDVGFDLLSDTFQEYPIEGATFMADIFQKDTRIIRKSTLVYDRFIKKYDEILKHFFSSYESERQMGMKQLVTVFAYNKLFDAAINACDKDRHEQPFDLAISNILQPYICEIVLPYFIKNKRNVETFYQPKLLQKNWTLDNCYSLSSYSQLSGEIDESMIMDVYWSLLKLFSLSSNRLFSSGFLNEVRNLFTMKFDEFDYLLKFPDGLAFRSEILRCFALFNIFPRNSAYGLKGIDEAPNVTSEGKFVKKKSVKEATIEEGVIPSNHCKELPSMILTELKRFNNVTPTLFKQKDMIKYIFKALLPLIYRYVNGMKHMSYTFTDENQISISTDIFPFLLEQMKILKGRIIKFIPKNLNDKAQEVSGEKYPGGAMCDNEKQVDKANEILQIIMSMVEGTRFSKSLENFNRRTSFYHYLELDHVCNHLETSIMFLRESGMETPDFSDKDAGKQKTAPGMVLMKMNEYISMKWKFLRKPFDSTFFQVLTSKLEETNQKNMVSFQIETTIGFDLHFGNKNHYLCNPDFLSLINFYSNMIFWSKRTRKFTFLYQAKNKQKRDYYFSIYFRSLKELGIMITMKPFLDDGWQEMWARFYVVNNFFRACIGNNNSKFKGYFGEFVPIPIEKLLEQESGNYHATMDTKPSMDNPRFNQKSSEYNRKSSRGSVSEQKDDTNDPKLPINRMKSGLKDLCSMTDVAFNLLQNNLKNPSPAGSKNPFVIEYYYLLDRSIFQTGLNKNKEKKIQLSDREELFPVIIMMLKTLKDLTNGASGINQELVYQLGIDIFMNTVLRIIDDITDDFYELKEEVLYFFVGLLQGRNIEIMNYIAYNFEVTVLYQQVITLVRKCFVMEAKKKDIINSLPKAEQEAKKLQWEKQAKVKRNDKKVQPPKPSQPQTLPKPDEKQPVALNHLAEALVDDYHEKFTINSKDEAKYYLKKWEDLPELYTQCETFSNSVVLKSANRLFSFQYKLAFDMQKYQIFLDNKERELKDLLKDHGFSLKDLEMRNYEMTGKSQSSEDLVIFYFLKLVNIQVEILTKHSKNEIMMCTKLPTTFFLSTTSMNKFTEVCPIDNTESKCTALMININQFQIEMDFNKDFKRMYPTQLELSTDKSFAIFRISIWMLGFLINCINLVFVKEDRHIEKVYTGGTVIDKIVDVLNIAMAIYGWLITCLWFVTRFPQIKLIEIDKYFLANSIEQIRFYEWVKICLVNSILLQPEVISFFCHGFLGFMSVSLGPIFTACNLLMIINISSTTKYVLNSVIKHADQLVSTFFQTVILVWVYAMVVAEYYVDAFDWEEGIIGSVKICSSYYKCFLYILNIGVRMGGGISDVMEIGSTTKQDFWGRLLFDLSFWLMINIISQNIIFGIIIDTFGELRDENETREYDLGNKCFICGIDRKTFDKKGVNFNIHQSYQHNLWDYVYFLITMYSIEKHKLSGYEYYVNSRFGKKHTNWIPINRTIYLASEDQKENKFDKQDKKQNMLQDNVFDYIDKKFDELADNQNDKQSQAGV